MFSECRTSFSFIDPLIITCLSTQSMWDELRLILARSLTYRRCCSKVSKPITAHVIKTCRWPQLSIKLLPRSLKYNPYPLRYLFSHNLKTTKCLQVLQLFFLKNLNLFQQKNCFYLCCRLVSIFVLIKKSSKLCLLHHVFGHLTSPLSQVWPNNLLNIANQFRIRLSTFRIR